jgi:hypothetical protein
LSTTVSVGSGSGSVAGSVSESADGSGILPGAPAVPLEALDDVDAGVVPVGDVALGEVVDADSDVSSPFSSPPQAASNPPTPKEINTTRRFISSTSLSNQAISNSLLL